MEKILTMVLIWFLFKINSLNSDEIYNLLVEVSSQTGINVKSQSTGITEGIDLGSNNFEIVKEPKIGLIVGEGVRSYDAGEIWHLLDTRFNIPITKLDVSDLGFIDLSRYTHIILPDYSEGLSISINWWEY